MAILKRLVGILLALTGLVPLAVGSWFAVKLGPSGEATFTVPDPGTTPVVFGPEVLNRTDLPVRIDVTTKPGGTARAIVGTSADIAAVLGDAERRTMTGVHVREWTALTTRSGSGATPDLNVRDVFRINEDLPERGSITMTQDTAPETLVIAPTGPGFAALSATWARDTWFYQALVLAAAGALLTTVGWLLARPGPKRRVVHVPAGTPVEATRAGVTR